MLNFFGEFAAHTGLARWRYTRDDGGVEVGVGLASACRTKWNFSGSFGEMDKKCVRKCIWNTEEGKVASVYVSRGSVPRLLPRGVASAALCGKAGKRGREGCFVSPGV